MTSALSGVSECGRVWEVHFLELAPVEVWFPKPVSFDEVMRRFPGAASAVPHLLESRHEHKSLPWLRIVS